MFTIITVIIISLGFAYFAVQNSIRVDIKFGQYIFYSIPLYLVILLSFFAGIFIAYFFNLINLISLKLNLKNKDKKIKNDQDNIAELTQKIHKLEIENSQIKKKIKKEFIDDKSL